MFSPVSSVHGEIFGRLGGGEKFETDFGKNPFHRVVDYATTRFVRITMSSTQENFVTVTDPGSLQHTLVRAQIVKIA